jgi:regulator of sigma E protease
MFFVLVTVHEWGHFYFAKRAGVFVHEFAIGFGPKLVSFKKGETRYTLRCIPFGGYVKMAGENGSEESDVPLERQFQTKSIGARALSIFAGPFMNFILAFLLFLAVTFMVGQPVGKPTQIKISKIVTKSAADLAGLRSGDVISSIEGQPVHANLGLVVKSIEHSIHQPAAWIVLRDGKEIKKSIQAKLTDGKPMIGVSLAIPQPKKTASISYAAKNATDMFVNGTKQIFFGFKMLITFQFKLDDLGGPVRITEYTGQAIQAGFSTYVFWSGMLSLYLGLFNLLPIPALDGSRLLFLGVEAVRRKPLESGRENIVHFIGMVLMMVLMVTVTFNDIWRLIKG